MASLNYLWSNRVKFSFASNKNLRAWAKRLLSFPELLSRNYRRIKLVNAGAKIDERAEIGDMTANGKKQNLSIGAFTFLGRIKIALHDEIIIGNNVCINDDVEILTASHDVLDPKWQHVKGKVVIDDYAWIATGALILPGVHIGRGAVIGAKAVVTKSIPPGAIVAGNPARPINKKRVEHLNYNPCEFLAANMAWLKN